MDERTGEMAGYKTSFSKQAVSIKKMNGCACSLIKK